MRSHYEEPGEEEALAEDKAAFESEPLAAMKVPKEWVPVVREMIIKYEAEKEQRA